MDLLTCVYLLLEHLMSWVSIQKKHGTAVHDANMVKSPGVKAERPNPFGLPDLIKPEGWVGPSHEDNHGDIPNII